MGFLAYNMKEETMLAHENMPTTYRFIFDVFICEGAKNKELVRQMDQKLRSMYPSEEEWMTMKMFKEHVGYVRALISSS